jgi:hypothetical protein
MSRGDVGQHSIARTWPRIGKCNVEKQTVTDQK